MNFRLKVNQLFLKWFCGLWSQEYWGTNPASGQGRNWSQGLRITSQVPLTTRPHCLLLKAFWKCKTQTILASLLPDKISYKTHACTNTVRGYKQISCTLFRLAKSQPHEWPHKFLSEQSELLRIFLSMQRELFRMQSGRASERATCPTWKISIAFCSKNGDWCHSHFWGFRWYMGVLDCIDSTTTKTI